MARRVERLLARFLAEEAERETGGFEPWLLEATFGEHEDSERPTLEIDGWGLHGAIDRVDRAPDGSALVLDYKLSGRVTPREKLEEKAKLQLQLYLLAVAEHWGASAVGGLYHPLRGTSVRRPRGAVLESAAGALASYRLYDSDLVDEAGLEELLAEARTRAGAIVARMRAGDIRRDPGPRAGLREHDVCPTYCELRPDLPSRPGAGRATRTSRWRTGERPAETVARSRVPTPEQAAAIAVAGRDVLLEAGAGTGKTGVMVERYCRLVCDEGASPDGDARLHLHRQGGGRAAPADPRRAGPARGGGVRARTRAAGRGSARAWITTIHGFCNRAARRPPGRRRDRPRLPRARRARRPSGPPARPSTRRWRSSSPRARTRGADLSPPSRSTGCGRSSPASTRSCAAAASPSRALPERSRSRTSSGRCDERSRRRQRRPWRS